MERASVSEAGGATDLNQQRYSSIISRLAIDCGSLFVSLMADHHPEIPLRQETLILASGSPRRRHLLRKAGIPFEAVVSAVEEWHRMDASPIDLVRRNAALKARAVALRLPGSPVLAADTIVSIDSILFCSETIRGIIS